MQACRCSCCWPWRLLWPDSPVCRQVSYQKNWKLYRLQDDVTNVVQQLRQQFRAAAGQRAPVSSTACSSTAEQGVQLPRIAGVAAVDELQPLQVSSTTRTQSGAPIAGSEGIFERLPTFIPPTVAASGVAQRPRTQDRKLGNAAGLPPSSHSDSKTARKPPPREHAHSTGAKRRPSTFSKAERFPEPKQNSASVAAAADNTEVCHTARPTSRSGQSEHQGNGESSSSRVEGKQTVKCTFGTARRFDGNEYQRQQSSSRSPSPVHKASRRRCCQCAIDT